MIIDKLARPQLADTAGAVSTLAAVLAAWQRSQAARILATVADPSGGWNNVFVVSEPGFFDWRALDIEAGIRPGRFRNGDIPLDRLRIEICRRSDRVHWDIDPAKPIIVVYKSDDLVAKAALESVPVRGEDHRVTIHRQDLHDDFLLSFFEFHANEAAIGRFCQS